VQSHSSSMPRTIRGFYMEAACSEFATSISLRLGHTSRDIVRIEVSGETEELGWHNMRFYLMKMEKVLDAYRGDVVWRYIVYRDIETGQEKRASVGSVVKLLEDTIVMGRDTDALRLKTPWMPPDMDWYMRKSWNDITTFQQLQMNELVRNKLQVLEKLAIAGDTPRQFPALWSLQYLPEEHKAIVRMHSDLSGRCYHVPIEIDTGSPLLARHASVFKVTHGWAIMQHEVASWTNLLVAYSVDGPIAVRDSRGECPVVPNRASSRQRGQVRYVPMMSTLKPTVKYSLPLTLLVTWRRSTRSPSRPRRARPQPH
jgi:hypothetical protein